MPKLRVRLLMGGPGINKRSSRITVEIKMNKLFSAVSGQGLLRWMIVLAFAVAFAVAFENFLPTYPQKITINGNEATIKFGRHYIVAQGENESYYSFLVNNGFYHSSRLPGFFVISMERVKELKSQYGDFVHCGSAGAEAGKESLYLIYLIPFNSEADKKIKGIMKERLNSPVIKITGHKLFIKEHTLRGKTYYSDYPGNEEFYLVKDVVITQRNFQ